ncbi:MAG: YciI family protein [Rhodospirillales bacterium]
MLFALTCIDRSDAGSLRPDTRPAHLEFLKTRLGDIRFAGPLLADDGDTVVGSLLILDVADKAAAEEFAANDPYAKAGLFADVTVRGCKQVIPGL